MSGAWLCDHREHLGAIALARIGPERLDRAREGRMLISIELGDLAALLRDGATRRDILLDRESSLERDRGRHRLAHRILQILRPRVERRAMQEDRARDVE